MVSFVGAVSMVTCIGVYGLSRFGNFFTTLLHVATPQLPQATSQRLRIHFQVTPSL